MGSDDVRETKTYYLIRELIEMGYTSIECHDPVSINKFKNQYNDLSVTYNQSLEQVINKNDVLIIAVHWPEYINIIYSDIVSDKLIIDTKYKLFDFAD